MSFLSRGSAPNSSGGVNPEKIELAITELDTVTDFFNKMVMSCHNKCISQRYAEGELNKGESVCIDRCVSKFHAVQNKVGEVLHKQNNANKQAGPEGLGL